MLENRVFGTEVEWGFRAVLPYDERAGKQVVPDSIISNLISKYFIQVPYAEQGGLRRVGTMLSNGGRLYSDLSHPEYCTPEVRSISDLIASELGSEEILLDVFENAKKLGHIGEYTLNKRVSDHDGNTWGAHENYQVLRRALNPLLYRTDHSDAYRMLGMHLATRNVLVGSGGIYRDGREYKLAVAQKALSLETDFSTTTTNNKPLINLRDRPLADVDKYVRLHLTSGDTNTLPRPTFLRTGSTLIVLALIEEGHLLGDNFRVADNGMHKLAIHTAKDISCKKLFTLENGSTILPVEMQYELALRADKIRDQGLMDDELCRAHDEWKHDIDEMSRDPDLLRDRVEWKLRERIQRGGVNLAVDLVFDQIKVDEVKEIDKGTGQVKIIKSITKVLRERRGIVEEMPSTSRIQEMKTTPPSDTRAHDRGRLITRIARRGAEGSAYWNEVTCYDRGVRVAMPDPRVSNDPRVERVLAAIG